MGKLLVVVFASLAFVIAGGACRPATTQEFRMLDCHTFPPDISAADLAARFGRANLTTESLSLGEGEREDGTVLFASRPDERVEILWKDVRAKRMPSKVRVYGDHSRWRTSQGFVLGMTLETLEALNGRPFELGGFSVDYEGIVSSWRGGHLESPKIEPCEVGVRLGSLYRVPKNSPDAEAAAEVDSGGSWNSDHRGMRVRRLTVSELWLDYR